APNNIVVAVAGDIYPDDAIKAVTTSFSQYSRKLPPPDSQEVEPEQISPRTQTVRENVNIAYFAIGYHSTGLLSSDLFPLDILASVLGQGDGSRLNSDVVKKKKLLQSVTCYNYTPKDPGLFIISGAGDPEKIEQAVSSVKEMIENIKNDGISDEEFDKVKANAVAEYLRGLETVQSRAAQTAEGQMFAGDPDFSERYVEGIKGVTRESLIKAAREYLKETNSSTVYLLPKDYKVSSVESNVNMEKTPAPRSSHMHTLPNGIRVVLKEDSNLPIVSVSVAFLGGLRAEPDGMNGISNLTSEMLLKGTKTRSEAEIKPAMEKLGADIGSYSGMNSFGVSAECLSADLNKVLLLVCDVIMNATFPDDELAKVKDRVIAAITIEDDDLFATGIHKLRRAIFGGHPYANRIIGRKESVRRVTRDDLVKFYAHLLNPKNMVISVVGGFNSQDVINLLEDSLGNIRQNPFRINTPEEIPLSDKISKVSYMPKREALFLIGFNGVTVKNNDKYALELIFSIMTGHGARLFTSIRGKGGLSYSQGGQSVTGVDPGYSFFYVASDERNVDKAGDMLVNEIIRLLKGGVTDLELEQAKKSFIGRHVISMQTNGAKALRMALDELYSLGYDDFEGYARFVNMITRDDIKVTAKKYLSPDRSVSLTILPAKEGK
ncbi:MAG: insulinase family protein, partial [Candidatus Omnitrophica bacterium]|nr:insulinase family protein [Candidatus Omnitrophota bacterium]